MKVHIIKKFFILYSNNINIERGNFNLFRELQHITADKRGIVIVSKITGRSKWFENEYEVQP